MPWNSVFPLGSVSVKANKIIGQDNTTYIETTMGNSIVGTNTNSTRDHFWNVGANEDGRHRFIQSPAFTVGGNPADAVIGTGMDTVLYPKTTNSRVEWFHRNAQGIFQFIPSYLTGTIVVNSSYSNIVTVPASVWGEIFMWRDQAGNHNGQAGFFKSNATVTDSWANAVAPEGESERAILKFGNGADASGLNIRVRTSNAASGNTWNYRVIYRAI